MNASGNTASSTARSAQRATSPMALSSVAAVSNGMLPAWTTAA